MFHLLPLPKISKSMMNLQATVQIRCVISARVMALLNIALYVGKDQFQRVENVQNNAKQIILITKVSAHSVLRNVILVMTFTITHAYHAVMTSFSIQAFVQHNAPKMIISLIKVFVLAKNNAQMKMLQDAEYAQIQDFAISACQTMKGNLIANTNKCFLLHFSSSF